ncbi:unnamed protein product [Urochloa humidicola]
MRASRPAVHPVEAPPPPPTVAAQAQAQEQEQGQGQGQGEGVAHPRGVRMKDPPGAPGTPAGLGLRLAQAFFAAAALAVMASTNDFPSVSAFSYLVAAAILQCLWSLSLAFIDIYALLVKRSLRNSRAVCIFTIGDGITENHCASFETATAMAFISWFALAPSCILNFWSMASR